MPRLLIFRSPSPAPELLSDPTICRCAIIGISPNNSYATWPLQLPGSVGRRNSPLHGDPVLTECACGLYGLRLMHRLNIFLFCFGHSAGQTIFFRLSAALTLTILPCNVI
ncbi:hypothetical protein C8J57DRAFT_522171 [Mycena rebaudengoi]|nr:hypothetical protein C8J57DRAFT_522171 [Mycena rebaudengoi]